MRLHDFLFRRFFYFIDMLTSISNAHFFSASCFQAIAFVYIFLKVLVSFSIILLSEMRSQKYKISVAVKFMSKPDMQVLRRLAQNREAARKSRLRKKVVP